MRGPRNLLEISGGLLMAPPHAKGEMCYCFVLIKNEYIEKAVLVQWYDLLPLMQRFVGSTRVRTTVIFDIYVRSLISTHNTDDKKMSFLPLPAILISRLQCPRLALWALDEEIPH